MRRAPTGPRSGGRPGPSTGSSTSCGVGTRRSRSSPVPAAGRGWTSGCWRAPTGSGPRTATTPWSGWRSSGGPGCSSARSGWARTSVRRAPTPPTGSSTCHCGCSWPSVGTRAWSGTSRRAPPRSSTPCARGPASTASSARCCTAATSCAPTTRTRPWSSGAPWRRTAPRPSSRSCRSPPAGGRPPGSSRCRGWTPSGGTGCGSDPRPASRRPSRSVVPAGSTPRWRGGARLRPGPRRRRVAPARPRGRARLPPPPHLLTPLAPTRPSRLDISGSPRSVDVARKPFPCHVDEPGCRAGPTGATVVTCARTTRPSTPTSRRAAPAASSASRRVAGGCTFAAVPRVATSGAATPRPPSTPTAHARTTGHRVVQSFEPGESWFYDYDDDEVFEGPGLAPPDSRPEDQPVPAPADAVPHDWRRFLH